MLPVQNVLLCLTYLAQHGFFAASKFKIALKTLQGALRRPLSEGHATLTILPSHSAHADEALRDMHPNKSGIEVQKLPRNHSCSDGLFFFSKLRTTLLFECQQGRSYFDLGQGRSEQLWR